MNRTRLRTAVRPPLRYSLGPMQGKLSLSLRDQTSLSNPGNEATLELRRGFSVGDDRLSALELKFTPRFDRDGRDKVEITASTAMRATDEVVLTAEASVKSPEQSFDVKAAVKTKGYLLSMEKSSRDPSALSLLEASKQAVVLGKACRFNAGVKLAPELAVVGKVEVALHPRLKLTPMLACRASDLKPSVVKLEASGRSPSNSFAWKVDLVPARSEASVEVREAVANGVWVAKATVPTDGSLGSSAVVLKREFVW